MGCRDGLGPTRRERARDIAARFRDACLKSRPLMTLPIELLKGRGAEMCQTDVRTRRLFGPVATAVPFSLKHSTLLI